MGFILLSEGLRRQLPKQKGGGYLKVIVQHNFRDKENDLVLRTVGEELEVSRKRAEYLANSQLVKTVEDQKGGDPKSPIEAQG